MSTNVPSITIGPTGVVVPPATSILSGVQSDINTAFGGNVNPALNTPQGQLASSEAAIIANADSQFAYLASQFDPAFASGRFQDGLARIYFLNRNPAQPTVVTATCFGLAGAVLPVGSQAIDQAGNIYNSTATVTISQNRFTGTISNGSGGSGTVLNVTAVAFGAVVPGMAFMSGAAAGTIVLAQTSGTPGGVGLYAVSVAQNSSGAFIAPDSVDVEFACAATGPVACPAGYLNAIYRASGGWDSVNNYAVGVLGNVVETRADFEYRRAASVALNSVGMLPSVLGAVFSVAGVLDAYATENVTSSPATVGGVTLAPNSLYVAVYGGVAQDIGNAIWLKKATGCNYNGNTTVTVVDESKYYTPPFPSYSVTFQVPTPTPIYFSIAMVNNPQVPSNAVTLVQNAVIAAFTGADGGARARIGGTIYASRYYGPISLLGQWAQINSILLGETSPGSATSQVMDIDQIPTITAANIAVIFS